VNLVEGLGLLPLEMHHLHSQYAEAGFFDLSDDFADVPGSGRVRLNDS
jgi:hypothetical protein